MKIKHKLLFLILLILPILSFSQASFNPWYTGPLLAVSANNLEKGQISLQPYLYFRDTYGSYNKSWGHKSTPSVFTFQAELDFQIGITQWLDVTFIGHAQQTNSKGEKSFQANDTQARFGIQVLKDQKNRAIPSVKLIVEQGVPTGKYKNLDPTKNGIDSSGSGSYETTGGIFFEKIVYWIKNHPLDLRLNASYTHSTKVKVKNFNTYGGGFNTDGKAKPGGAYNLIFAFQFSFTQRCVLAMDVAYSYSNKTTFKGINGALATGRQASNTKSITDQLSLAPAIEYNFNDSLGIIIGSHFSVMGKNSTEFASGIISAVYTF